MKKIFLFLIISIFLMSLVSTWSYSEEATHIWDLSLYAYVKVTGMYPACEGNQNGKYCAGKWYVDVSHIGDKFYIAYKANDWPYVWLNGFEQSGYRGQGVQLTQDGRKYLNENGLVPKYVLCAMDYDEGIKLWTWAWKCAGYLGDYFDRYHVECYDNSDCSSGQICDKSGDWRTWSCKTDPCRYITCDDKCQNSVKYYNGYCKDGECNYQTETCTYGCFGKLCAEDPCKGVVCDDKCENSVWYYDGYCVNGNCVYGSKGKIIGKCGVECETIGERDCIENDLVICVNNKWSVEKTCQIQCLDGQCITIPPQPKPIVIQFFINIWDWIKSIFGG